jgi:hypothetical protein
VTAAIAEGGVEDSGLDRVPLSFGPRGREWPILLPRAQAPEDVPLHDQTETRPGSEVEHEAPVSRLEKEGALPRDPREAGHAVPRKVLPEVEKGLLRGSGGLPCPRLADGRGVLPEETVDARRLWLGVEPQPRVPLEVEGEGAGGAEQRARQMAPPYSGKDLLEKLVEGRSVQKPLIP